MGLECPQAMTPDYFVVLYYGEELGPAMKGAVRSMVDFLVREKGMEPYDAYTLLSAWPGTCECPEPSAPSARSR